MNIGIYILSISYFATAIFYIASGILIISYPKIIEKRIGTLFPLLHSFNLKNTANSINLIIMGFVLFGTTLLLKDRNFLGFYLVLVFSVWEIYLSFALYLKRQDYVNAFIHLILHIIIACFIIYISN
jgi:hypothetical protein